MTIDEATKDNCYGKCTNCSNTELPNIKDCKEIDIDYSYAYKTDCAGDRYIKAEEVKYLLECERNKAIDDFAEKICEILEEYQTGFNMVSMANIWHFSIEFAEQLKEGILND